MYLLAAAPITVLVTFAAKDQVSRKWKPAPYWSILGRGMQSSNAPQIVLRAFVTIEFVECLQLCCQQFSSQRE